MKLLCKKVPLEQDRFLEFLEKQAGNTNSKTRTPVFARESESDNHVLHYQSGVKVEIISCHEIELLEILFKFRIEHQKLLKQKGLSHHSSATLYSILYRMIILAQILGIEPESIKKF